MCQKVYSMDEITSKSTVHLMIRKKFFNSASEKEYLSSSSSGWMLSGKKEFSTSNPTRKFILLTASKNMWSFLNNVVRPMISTQESKTIVYLHFGFEH